MVGEIIVAVACNLVALLILVSGVITAKSNGVIVTIVKMLGTLGGIVGGYFVTPVISDKVYSYSGVTEVLQNVIGISKGTVNSCIFAMFLLAVYAFTLIICSIIRHALIKKMQDKKINRAKMKRARSINPRAEKSVRRAEWKLAKARYYEKRRWYNKLFSCLLGMIVSVALGIVLLMPVDYLCRDIDKKSNRPYLVTGLNYTLNGVIPDTFFNWVIHNEETKSEKPSEDVPPVCEHTYQEGVCTLCGDTEITVPVEPETPEVESSEETTKE